MYFGINFGAMLVDFGSQVGAENRAQIDPKRHRKNDGKKKGTRIAKKPLKIRCGILSGSAKTNFLGHFWFFW